MEIYPVFSNWKNQYCQNDHIIHRQSIDSVNPSQIINGIFLRTRTNNLKIFMETQKTPNSQKKNLEKKKKESWRNHTL